MYNIFKNLFVFCGIGTYNTTNIMIKKKIVVSDELQGLVKVLQVSETNSIRTPVTRWPDVG